MSEQSFMERFGPRLVANGYPILPIMPGTKKPGRFRNGALVGLSRLDPARRARPTTEHELGRLADLAGRRRRHRLRAGRRASTSTSPIPSSRSSSSGSAARGSATRRRSGSAGRRSGCWSTARRRRSPASAARRSRCSGLGQQFVAHAIHPDTGRPYEWPEDSLADLDIGDLPAVDEAGVRAFLDEALALVPDHLKPSAACRGAAVDTASSHSQAGTLAAIREALAWIPNADLDYDSWVRIGLALKGALGDAGGDLFAAWSAQSGKDDAAFTAKTWAGLKAERIGAGTIYHLAMERGWKPDPALVLDGAAPCDAVHPAAGLLAKVQAVAANRPSRPEPTIDAAAAPGARLAWTAHSAHGLDNPRDGDPPAALARRRRRLAALGTLMGRKVRTASNLRSNLYVVGMAESGGGKDHARKVIKEVLFQAGLADHLGGKRIASGAGLITALTRQPASLFQIDEFGKFVANVADKRRAPKHLSEILGSVHRARHQRRQHVLRRRIRRPDSERPRQDIIEPCASIHGVSAPGPFWEALKSGSLQDGSLARFLVFRSDDDIPDRNRRPAPLSDLPAELLAAVQAVAAVGADQPRGNLAGIGAPGVKPAPLTVPMDAEAIGDLRRARRRDDRVVSGRRSAPTRALPSRGSGRTPPRWR